MDKRVIIAIVLCVGVLIVWTQLFSARSRRARRRCRRRRRRPRRRGPDGAAAVGRGRARPTPAARRGAAAAPVCDRPERQVELVDAGGRASCSRAGAARWCTRSCARSSSSTTRTIRRAGTTSCARRTPSMPPLRIAFPESGFPTPADGAWEVSQPAPGHGRVRRRRRQRPHREALPRWTRRATGCTLDVVVANRGDAPVDQQPGRSSVSGRQDPDKRGGGFFSGRVRQRGVGGLLRQRQRRARVDRGAWPRIRSTRSERHVSWIATDEKFFLLAAVPYPEVPPRDRACAAHATGTRRRSGDAVVRGAHGRRRAGEISYPFIVFAGPKDMDDLEAVRAGRAAPAPAAPTAAAPRSTSTRRSTSRWRSCRGRSCRC